MPAERDSQRESRWSVTRGDSEEYREVGYVSSVWVICIWTQAIVHLADRHHSPSLGELSHWQRGAHRESLAGQPSEGTLWCSERWDRLIVRDSLDPALSRLLLPSSSFVFALA